MKLCVIGTGYVGLVAGTCFAESGNDVVCIDNVVDKIEGLRRGVVPIYEPGLAELIRRNVSEARLSFSTDLADAVRRSVVCFIAVGTPGDDDGSADLSGVMAVARDIGRAMDGYRVVVAKSTVPGGTSTRIRDAHLVHERDREPLRAGRRGRRPGAARDRLRPPDRPPLPLPGRGLRRLLLSEGREGGHPHRARAGPGLPGAGGRGSGERGAEA